MGISRRDFLKIAGASLLFNKVLVSEGYSYNLKIPVLLYHEITHRLKGDYSVRPEDFASQMEFLYQSGYKTIFVKEIPLAINEGLTDVVVITFDDGSLSFIDYAFPLLSHYNFKVTMNLVGSWVNSKAQVLSWDECRFLKETGLVDFGCHSWNAHNPPNGYLALSENEADMDMKKFQDTMKNRLGELAEVLSWPFGKYNGKTIEIAKRNGFKFMLTSHMGYYIKWTPFTVIPRINVGNSMDINKFKGIIGGQL